jgi:hypothetical protein
VTIKPDAIDAAAAGGGMLASVWNFLVGGEFNTLLGAAVGILSVVILVQRFTINRKELKKLNKSQKE